MRNSASVTDPADANQAGSSAEDLGELLVEVLPGDGKAVDEHSAREALSRVAGRSIRREEYEAVKRRLVDLEGIRRSKGRGGSIHLAEGVEGGRLYEEVKRPSSRRDKNVNEDPITGHQIGHKLTLKQLESLLWLSSGILKTSFGISDFKTHLLGILSIKRLSDAFEEERETIIRKYLDLGKTLEESEALAENHEEYQETFYIPCQGRWYNLQNLTDDVGAHLNRAAEEIEDHCPPLKGVLTSIDFDIPSRNGKWALLDLISHLSRFRLRNEDLEDARQLGLACDMLIARLADAEGRRGPQGNTPSELGKLIASILKPKAGMRVYDPTCGSGDLLLQTTHYVEDHGENAADLHLFGQEINKSTWTTCKLNMFLHGAFNAEVGQGDTLNEPQYVRNRNIMQFDRVMADIPFSLGNWDDGRAEKDTFNRYCFGIPPRKSGDLAFVQHMIASLNPEGVMAVLVPHGALFRGGSEGEIRKRIIEHDLVEAVIGLPPSLLYATSIPTAILVINKNKPTDRKDRVLFIDASQGFAKRRIRNLLRDEDIARIAECYYEYRPIDAYSSVVGLDIIRENDYTLSIRRYADASPEAAQAKRLLKQYEDYSLYSLSDLTVETNVARADLIGDKESNCIYISMAANTEVATDLHKAKSNQRYTLQLRLDPKIALSEYVGLFLRSELGRISLKSISQGPGLLHQSRWEQALSDLKIPVPDIPNQEKIIHASKRLETLEKHVEELKANVALSPLSTSTVLERVDNMMEVIGGLTESERIMSLIRKGESGTLEFKETFTLDVRNGTREKQLELSCLKTIAAFLNTDGGVLLIGVSDEGGTPGIGREVEKFHKGKNDKFLLHFKNQLKTRIGEEFYPFIKHRIVALGDKCVLLTECRRSAKACFLDGKDFYVRTNPATDKLEGPKLVDYIQNHFSA